MSAYRAVINKVFTRKYQFSLQPDAVSLLEDIITEYDFEEDQVQGALEAIAKECQKQEDCGTIIHRNLIERVYNLMKEAAEAENSNLLDAAGLDPDHHFFVIDAFEMPNWQYSAERKTFEKVQVKSGVAGASTSLAHLMRNRHNVIKQLVLRNENFSPPISGRERANYLKITSTKDLLGHAGERFLLFGMLSHLPDGKLCLEDVDGRVALDIADTAPSEGLFTEGCLVLVEGDYTDDATVSVLAIGHPPSERRSVTRSIYGHIDMLGKGATTLLEDEKYREQLADLSELAFLVLSDLWLDHPQTLVGLRRVLDGCVEHNFIPFAFIFCGNFNSRGTTQVGIQRYQENFEALADVLQSYPSIYDSSHFVFVPGPTDPWSSAALPRGALPIGLTAKIRNRIPKSHFASNPCRIKFFGQEIVIFREDLMDRMLRSLIGVKPDLSGVDLRRYLVQTIIDQCHLSPLPQSVQAILWEFDHSLRLYPMPTTLILADNSERYELTYEGCHVFNPGNFVGNEYGFSTYFPSSGRSESSSIADEVET